MRKKFLLAQFWAVLSALMVCVIVSSLLFNHTMIQDRKETLQLMSQTMSSFYDPENGPQERIEALAAANQSVRITLIAPDGTVLADSSHNAEEMENHLDRPEIQALIEGKEKVTIRTSETTGKTMMYAVTRTEDGNYLRLSRERGDAADEALKIAPALVIATVLGLLVSLSLTTQLTQLVMEPIHRLEQSVRWIRKGEEPPEPEQCAVPELKKITEDICTMSGEIRTHLLRLEEQQRRTAYILNHLEEGVILLDQNQRIVTLNDSGAKQLGCTGDAIGLPLGKLLPNPKMLQLISHVQQQGGTERSDLQMKGRIYELCCRLPTKRKVLDGHMILTLNDMTEERRSSQMRQDFFSNASHELKTPITAIRGNTELLCSGLPLTEDQRSELLQRIGIETNRMTNVIEDIIMLSRLESGVLQEECELVELEEVVEECAEEWACAAASRGVRINCDLKPVTVYGSRKNLRELADNLISNAVKYNRPEGKVDVLLTGWEGTCCLSVRNDGEPIPPEHQRRVFERFYRVDRGRSRSAGGTGLGLSIVKHVVERMEGTIRLESSHDTGTRFTVTLPVKLPEER